MEDVEEDLEHNPIGTQGVGMGYVMANTVENKADDHSAQIQKMKTLFDAS